MNGASETILPQHDLQHIPVDKIHKSPHQMRRHFDEEAIRELADSLKQKGLVQPIAVRQMGGAFELIAGERRLRAAVLLNWETIPAIILANRDDADAAVLGLIENLQRVNLNPLEEARGYKQLTDPPYNMTQEAIAEKIGKQKSTICRMLALLDLPEEVQDLLPRGNITEAHTRFLRQIPDKRRQVELANTAAAHNWSVKEMERQVNAIISPEKNNAGSGKIDKSTANSAIRLTWRGDQLRVEATLHLQREPLEQAVERLKSAVEAYLRLHPKPATSPKPD